MPPKEGRQSKRPDGAAKTSSLSASMAAKAGRGGALQLASIFAQFSGETSSLESSRRPNSEGHPVAEVNEAVVAMLKKMTKRSDATRVKGLEEFTNYLEGIEERNSELSSKDGSSTSEIDPQIVKIEEEVLGWLPEFCRVYRAGVLMDSNRRIRQGMNRSWTLIIQIVGRQIAVFLRSVFPVWWISCHDRHRDVSSAAKEALAVAFPENKKRLDLMEYTRDCLIDECVRLLSHTEDSLHLDLFGPSFTSIPSGIRQERFDRVIAASLISLSQLIVLLGEGKLVDWEEDLKPFFASNRTPLLRFLSTSKYRPAIRCAAAESLTLILATYLKVSEGAGARIPLYDEDAKKELSLACLGIFGDNDSSVQFVAPDLFIAFLRLFPEQFTISKPEKIVYPRLLSAIRHGAYSTSLSDVRLWRDLPAVISAIPSSHLIGTDSGREFLRMLCPNILLGLNKVDSSTVSFGTKPRSTDIFSCFFQVLIFVMEKRILPAAAPSETPLPSSSLSPAPNSRFECTHLLNALIDQWLWCPIELYLSSLLSHDGHGRLDLSLRVRLPPNENSQLDLHPSELTQIPSICSWALTESLNRQCPPSLKVRLGSLLEESSPAIFSFTQQPKSITTEHVSHAEQFVQLFSSLNIDEQIRSKISSEGLRAITHCLAELLKQFDSSNGQSSDLVQRIELISKLMKVVLTSFSSNDFRPETSPTSPDWISETVIAFLKVPLASMTTQFLLPTNGSSDLEFFEAKLTVLELLMTCLIRPIHDSSSVRGKSKLEMMVVQMLVGCTSSLDSSSTTVSQTECPSMTTSAYWDNFIGPLVSPFGLSLLLAVVLLKELDHENRTAFELLPLALRQSLEFDVMASLKNGSWDRCGIQRLEILQQQLFDFTTQVIETDRVDQEISPSRTQACPIRGTSCLCSIVDVLLRCGCQNGTKILRELGTSKTDESSKNALIHIDNTIGFVFRSLKKTLTLACEIGTLPSGPVGADHFCFATEFSFEMILSFQRLQDQLSQVGVSQLEDTENEDDRKSSAISVLTSALMYLGQHDSSRAESLLKAQIIKLFEAVVEDVPMDDTLGLTDRCLAQIEWIDAGIILTQLMPNNSRPSILGVCEGFWNVLKLYIESLNCSVTTYFSSLPIEGQLSLSCYLMGLLIACDRPVPIENIPSPNDGSIALDFIIVIWMSVLRSRDLTLSDPITSYLQDGLREVLVSRLWMDSLINSAGLLRRTLQLMSESQLTRCESQHAMYRTLLMEVLDVILVEMKSKKEAEEMLSKLFGETCVEVLFGSSLPNQDSLLSLWDSQTPVAHTLLNTFLGWLIRRGIPIEGESILELRDHVFQSMAASVGALEATVMSAEPGDYPIKDALTLRRILPLLADIMTLTDEEQINEDATILLQLTQKLFGLIESSALHLSYIPQGGMELVHLETVESACRWATYVAVSCSKHALNQQLAWTVLLTIKDSFLIQKRPKLVNDVPRVSSFKLMANSLHVLGVILGRSNSDLVDEVETLAATAALTHLARCDGTAITYDHKKVIAECLKTIGMLCSRSVANDATRMRSSLEGREPINNSSTSLIYLLTWCAMRSKWPFLQVQAFQTLDDIKFPWMKIPLFQLSAANSLREGARGSVPTAPTQPGTATTQLLSILEESCIPTPASSKVQKTTPSDGIRSLLLLLLGDYFGTCIGGIGAFTDSLLSQLADHESHLSLTDIRIVLNFWLILLTSLKRQQNEEDSRQLEQTNALKSTKSILEIRPEMIQIPDHLNYRLRQIARKLPITVDEASFPHVSSEGQFLQLFERSVDYDESPLLHGIVELSALLMVLGQNKEDEPLLSQLVSSINTPSTTRSLIPRQLRIPPIVRAEVALLKRRILGHDWIPASVICPMGGLGQGKELGGETVWDTESDFISRLAKDPSISIESIPVLSQAAATSFNSLWVLAGRVLLLIAELFPVSFRHCLSVERSSWLNTKTLFRFEQIVRSVITPRLLQVEVDAVKRALVEGDEDATLLEDDAKKGISNVQFDRPLRQLRCRISSEELSIEVAVEFHDTHPLRCPNLKLISTTGMPKAKVDRWIFSSKQILLGGRDLLPSGVSESAKQPAGDSWDSSAGPAQDAQNNGMMILRCSGGATAALTLFKANVQGFLSGLEECSICYAIVHGRTRALPKQKCNTCKYKFHAECLDRWFRTSHKNVCPLCQTEFL